jgi:hypothetical protein
VSEEDSSPEPKKHHRPFGEDDLLAGFDRVGRPHGLRAFFATTLAGSLFVWEIGWNLGAYHTVFYTRLFQILVVSTVMLLGSIVLRHTIEVRAWNRVILSLPLLWLISRWVAPFGHRSQAARVLDDILITVTVVTVPFTMVALARIMAPDYFALGTHRLKATAVLIMTIVFAGGVVLGQFNYKVTDCSQYVVAGNDEPSNCRPTPSASPSP